MNKPPVFVFNMRTGAGRTASPAETRRYYKTERKMRIFTPECPKGYIQVDYGAPYIIKK